MIITKELLESVFNLKITTDITIENAFDNVNGVELEWEEVKFNFISFPLDFVVRKCKEWVFENTKRSISSEYSKNGFRKKKSWKIGIRFGNCPEYFIADSEAEGIFKACQWILKYNKES